MSEPKRKTVFRRIRGRIVPISVVSSGAVAGTVGGIAALSRIKSAPPRSSKSGFGNKAKITGLVGIGMASQVVSGLVSGLPRKMKWIAAGTAASIGIDVGTSAIFAKAAMMGSNDKKERIKSFAKYQAVGGAVGWGVYGGTLLADAKVRSKIAFLARKLITRGK